MSETITFQLSFELGEFIESLIQTGGYNNQSEVIRAGLQLLREKTVSPKLSQLRYLIDEGEDSGDSMLWDMDTFLEKQK